MVDGPHADDGGESRMRHIQAALESALQHAQRQAYAVGRGEFMGEVCDFVNQTRCREPDTDDLLAGQLDQLFSTYFCNDDEARCLVLEPATIIEALARKTNYLQSGMLWPEGSWVGCHSPNPTWLSREEVTNVLGIEVARYKQILRDLGYGPVPAGTKDALDQIWHDLCNPCSSKENVTLETSDAERYAVVSYVQCVGKPPATWTSEVDTVLTDLVELKVITDKPVWFDKLASRQYRDSQKWWGAAATMQFLFNPVIALLPRMSEQQSFVPVVGQTIWGSNEADRIFESFLEHANNCTECRESYVLRWALQQDCVLPIATLRTWPRVEHALGFSALGLFTSEITYTALVAMLTCTLAMFSAMSMDNKVLHNALCAADLLPSSYTQRDGSVLIGWVHVSCSNWHHDTNPGNSITPGLSKMASCMMELYHLFCKLQTPKQLALMTQSDGDGLMQYKMNEYKQNGGLAYVTTGPWDQDVDVPLLARLNSNDTRNIHHNWSSIQFDFEYAITQARWATANIVRNFGAATRGGQGKSISNDQFLVARHHALTTLVHTRAAYAPCYAWDDKLVAAILLSSPKVFSEAFLIWEDHKKGGFMLPALTELLSSGGVLVEGEDVDWEPNTLIVALAATQGQSVHRLVPRPLVTSQHEPVHVSPLTRDCPDDVSGSGDDKGTQKCFGGYFLGHLPLRTLEDLRFKTTSGTDLPLVKDWVYRNLQDTSLTDVNMAVYRQQWTGPSDPDPEDLLCWHCYNILESGGADEFRFDLTGVLWGLGSFDPLNLAALLNRNYYFGLAPDCVAVLLEHGVSDQNTVHAHALAHFTIMGGSDDPRVHKCSMCNAILVEERDRRPAHADELLAVWSLCPFDSYKPRGDFIHGIGVIRGSS